MFDASFPIRMFVFHLVFPTDEAPSPPPNMSPSTSDRPSSTHTTNRSESESPQLTFFITNPPSRLSVFVWGSEGNWKLMKGTEGTFLRVRVNAAQIISSCRRSSWRDQNQQWMYPPNTYCRCGQGFVDFCCTTLSLFNSYLRYIRMPHRDTVWCVSLLQWTRVLN